MDIVTGSSTPKRKRRSTSGLLLPDATSSGQGGSEAKAPGSPPPIHYSTSPVRGAGSTAHKTVRISGYGGDQSLIGSSSSGAGGVPAAVLAAAAAGGAGGSGISPSSSLSSDRFIPNRSSIDFDFCNSTLLKENAHNDPRLPQPDSITLKHINILAQTNSVLTKRLVVCFDGKSGDGATGGAASVTGEVGGGMVSSNSSSSSSSSSSNSNSSSSSSGITSGGDVMASSRDDGFSRLCGDDDGDDKHGSALLLGGASPSRSSSRVIPAGPSKILDAPDLMDDYYLNLLSWGKNNVLAVALRNTVYLWHAADGAIETLFACTNDDYVCSLQWCGDASLLAVGTSSGAVEVWDTNVKVRVRLLSGGHTARISALAWQGQSQHCLSTGGRDTTVLNHDLRIPGTGEVTSKFLAHIQEVCGLAWSECGSTLASGGNENRLCLWDSVGGRGGSYRAPDGSHQPRFIIEQHLAAVKALAWCPWSRHTLASGGGTADRTIRIWNASSGSMLRCTDTGSQVCALQWSNTEKELVSSHGFSDNQLILWKYPTLTRIKEFRGHTARVLHLAKSPDGRTICSASADETIRFWDLFDPKVVSAGGGFGSPKGKGPGFSPKALLGGAMGDIR